MGSNRFNKLPDISVYFITDNGFGWSHEELINKVSKAGVKIIQFREKNEPTKKLIEVGRKLKKVSEDRKVKLIVNDRVDVALAINSDGVHLGQNDMSIEDARDLLGSDKIIGASVKTVSEAIDAENKGADYLGVGPIFSTSTKEDAGEGIGLNRLNKISKKVNIPIVGIGGINKDNAKKVVENGADGVAIISDIANSSNPKKDAQKLLKIVKNH